MSFQAIHKDVKRVDGLEKVTGTALYVGDLKFPGMMVIKVLRSPYAHAVIKGIDADEARKTPGVAAVLTGEDVPGPFGVAVADQHPIAKGKVRFAGEPVAVAIGQTERAADRALKKIRVEYQPLPFNVIPRRAVEPDAPILHEGLMEYKVAPYVIREGGNVYQHFKVRKGDAQAAFADCDLVVEGDFSVPYIQHAMMEPHCAVACYKADHSMVMYATTQAPFVVQECISELHEIPRHKVRVIAPYLGGGFGGKSDITIEALVSCCARAVPGRYVKLLLTREEMFGGVTLGRGGDTTYRLGFRKDGKLLAMEGTGYLGSGGNADYAVNIVSGMALAGTGPYEVEDLSLDMYGVYTNTPPVGAARAYGHPEVHMPVERLMDRAAEQLGMAPHELRLKNLLAPGKINGIGQPHTEHTGDVRKCTEMVAERLFGGQKPDKGPDIAVGRGIAAYMKTPCMPSNVQSGAMLKLSVDGTVNIATGAIEMGQGTYTALAQIAAEALGISEEKISLHREVDTFVSPYEWQTVASHTTWGCGNAILLAADDLKAKIREAAALYLGGDSGDIVLEDGNAKYGEKSVPWGDLAIGARNPDGTAMTKPLEGYGYFVPDGIQNPDPETGQTNAAADWTVGCVGAEVGVNRRTGEIHVYRLINCIDAGTIINPKNAREQVKGAMTLVVGSTLSETLVFSEDRGHIRNNTLVDYKIPGIEDLPESMEVLFVETPEESGPYGAKGLGEHGSVAPAPAMLNAIYDAIGKQFHTLPVTADNIIAALKEVE